MQAVLTSLLMAILVACLVFYIILSVTDTVTGRILRLNTLDDLISDGVDADVTQAPFLNPGSSPSSRCVHSYGFFPCADNIGGYIFEIVVYQYLVIIGGKLISRGSKRLFNILGTGVYGATVFRILTVLPKIAMVIGKSFLNLSFFSFVFFEWEINMVFCFYFQCQEFSRAKRVLKNLFHSV